MHGHVFLMAGTNGLSGVVSIKDVTCFKEQRMITFSFKTNIYANFSHISCDGCNSVGLLAKLLDDSGSRC